MPRTRAKASISTQTFMRNGAAKGVHGAGTVTTKDGGTAGVPASDPPVRGMPTGENTARKNGPAKAHRSFPPRRPGVPLSGNGIRRSNFQSFPWKNEWPTINRSTTKARVLKYRGKRRVTAKKDGTRPEAVTRNLLQKAPQTRTGKKQCPPLHQQCPIPLPLPDRPPRKRAWCPASWEFSEKNQQPRPDGLSLSQNISVKTSRGRAAGTPKRTALRYHFKVLLFWAYTVKHFYNNPLTGSRAFAGRVEPASTAPDRPLLFLQYYT